MHALLGHLRVKPARSSVLRGILLVPLDAFGSVFRRTLTVYSLSKHYFVRLGYSYTYKSGSGPYTARNHRFRSFSTDFPGEHVTDTACDTEYLDDLIQALEREDNSWWSLYVRGKVPDYPPRREMFEALTAEGVDVECMEAFEVEDFTRWLLMRKKYGPGYPKMPYDVTLEQKIAELKRRIPLSRTCDDVTPSSEAEE